jgi:hypothetical protein
VTNAVQGSPKTILKTLDFDSSRCFGLSTLELFLFIALRLRALNKAAFADVVALDFSEL